MEAYEYFLYILDKAVKKAGSPSRLAYSLNMAPNMITRWYKQERIPTLRSIQPVLDYMNADFRTGDAVVDKTVKFVTPRRAEAGKNGTLPDSEEFIATPLVGEMGAGPGYFSQDVIKSWMVVNKNQSAVRGRRNIIAVEIGQHSTSMQPLLSPGDVVLVDRDDTDVSRPGRIMLVRTPDGAGMVKRVSVRRSQDGRVQIVFYSDNAASNPPQTYQLDEDYHGDMGAAVVGRVISSLADIKNR